jgi:hypothetical protein
MPTFIGAFSLTPDTVFIFLNLLGDTVGGNQLLEQLLWHISCSFEEMSKSPTLNGIKIMVPRPEGGIGVRAYHQEEAIISICPPQLNLAIGFLLENFSTSVQNEYFYL